VVASSLRATTRAVRPGGSSRGARSARARGLRTLQHQSLPAATRFAIDTEVWLRTLVLEGWSSASGAPEARWATKDQVHDEALIWFLEQHAVAPVQPSSRSPGVTEDLTFWLDSQLLSRARQLARRSGMRVAQLIERALDAYVAAHVPAQLLSFRRRVQTQAQRVHRERLERAAGMRGRTQERAHGRSRERGAPGRSRAQD
jgi:hypothetical protein